VEGAVCGQLSVDVVSGKQIQVGCLLLECQLHHVILTSCFSSSSFWCVFLLCTPHLPCSGVLIVKKHLLQNAIPSQPGHKISLMRLLLLSSLWFFSFFLFLPAVCVVVFVFVLVLVLWLFDCDGCRCVSVLFGFAGGGTVFFVSEDSHRYLENLEEREEGMKRRLWQQFQLFSIVAGH
jgi:hypothetical protein